MDLDRSKLYFIAAGALVIILIASLAFQVMEKQAPANPEKEKVKNRLLNATCADKRFKGSSFYECDNGFYSTETCAECWNCYYDNQGNLTKCCGGYREECKVYRDYEVANCSKRDLCG